MNKIFKVVWSKVKHCYVVVSEIAKNTTSGGARRCRMGKVSLAAAMAAAVLTSSFAMPNSAWAAEIVTATMQNYIAIKGVDSVGDDTSIYEDYQKDRFGDYIYDTNGNKIIDWNSILSVDSTKEIDGYNYILRKIDSPNNDGYYWVREGYDIKIINNDKYFLGAQVNYKVSPYATVSNPSSDNLAFAARNGIVDTEDKTAVNNDILHKLTYTNYVAGTNGGIDVPEGWNYYIYRDDQNGVKRAVDVGINLNENFKEVTYNNETGHYQFNGEDVQFENVYAITLGKDTSPTIGVFLTSENGNEVYTGPVYGLNNEILVTAYDSQSKTWSTVWGVEMPDPNASIASMTVGQFQDVLDDIHAEDVILSNADIEKTVVNGTNGNGTINLQNKKGNVVPGIEISRSAVQGQNTVITISDADNGTISLETGSRVVANGGETYDSTNNTLETISINGNEYRIAAGGGTGTMSSWTAKVGKDKAIIGNGVELEFKGAGDASVSLNGNTITISATDTNRYTTGVTAVKSGKTITTSYSQEGNNATNFDGINFKEGSNVTLGLEGRTITVNADNYYVTGVSTNKSSDNSVDVKISTNNPIKGYDEYKIGFVQGNDNVEIDVDENGKIKISTQDENNFTVAAEYDSNTKKINFYRDNANKQNPDYFVELDNVATTGDITNLQNKGIKEIGIANNTISLIRNDNSNTVVDGSLIFGTGGGEKENGEYVDTYVTIGQEGKLDAIKLNTGSLVRGEGKVVAGSGENKSLSKITINGEVFNVPLVVPNATAGENGETTYTLEYLDINGKTYKVAQSIQGEGHDWGLTGEVGKDDEKNTAGTPVGWQSSSYTVPGDGEVKLNMLNRTTGEVQEDQIVIKDVASATKLANEVSRAQGVEAQLSQAITDEVAAREANDAALSEMITAETNRAAAAEEALGNAINAETARAQGVEAQLSQAITDEAAARKANDAALSEMITAETNRATAAEEALGNAINAETARAQEVEAQLSQAITDEAAAREANDAALSEMITAETNRAAAAEEALGNAINAETARAQGVEAQLSQAITDEAAAREANDAALSEMITAETNRAAAAEEALGNAINAETARAQEVEAQLSQAITDEAAARKANDAALSDMITAEANRAAAAEAALGDAINAETARAQGVEAQLSEAITNEAAERFANDIVSGAINSQNGSISLTKNNGETITLDGEICDSRLDNVSFDASTGKMTFTVKDHYNNDVQNSIVVSDIASKTALEKEVSDRIAVDNYLYETMNKNDQYLDSKINHLGSKVNKVGAGAAALAALHPMDFDPDDKLSFAVGAGNYAGETATALGAFYRPNEKVMMNVAGTYGNGENMVNMGVSFALDRTNNVSNSRTAMAREIVDLREQVATQGQQIAQLVALVNQLTGVKEPVAPTVQPFPDVPANHWAYEYLNNLVAMGVIEGYPDGTFGGDRTMTRYEFATMLFKAMQNGAVLSEQIRQEFNAELGRIRVDRIKGADDDANKIERVRVNNYEDRDDYGSKIVMVSAGK